MSIHESSIIHPSAEIDENVEIGPFCIVGEKVKVKSGSKLLSHVVLRGPTTAVSYTHLTLPTTPYV